MSENIFKGLICKGCGTKYVPPMNTCLSCGSDKFEETQLALQGEVLSFTDIHRSSLPVPQPFRMVIVKLDDGAKVCTRLRDFIEGATNIGDRVMFDGYYDEKTPLFKQI